MLIAHWASPLVHSRGWDARAHRPFLQVFGAYSFPDLAQVPRDLFCFREKAGSSRCFCISPHLRELEALVKSVFAGFLAIMINYLPSLSYSPQWDFFTCRYCLVEEC